MGQKGNLIVVSGFSGVGKGTVMKTLMNNYEGYALSISATTRLPRVGEENGKEYFFVDDNTFTDMIKHHELIEYATYCDHYYGTPRKYVEEQLQEGKDVILEIEIQGAMKIRSQFKDAILVFIMPPSAQALKERLTGRGTEEASVIEARMARAALESDGIENYDFIFVNDTPEDCAARIHELMQCMRSKPASNEEFINEIRKQVKAYNKGE